MPIIAGNTRNTTISFWSVSGTRHSKKANEQIFPIFRSVSVHSAYSMDNCLMFEDGTDKLLFHGLLFDLLVAVGQQNITVPFEKDCQSGSNGACDSTALAPGMLFHTRWSEQVRNF